jgi:hypothetical protein
MSQPQKDYTGRQGQPKTAHNGNGLLSTNSDDKIVKAFYALLLTDFFRDIFIVLK